MKRKRCPCGCPDPVPDRKGAIWASEACAKRWKRENPGKNIRDVLAAQEADKARTGTRPPTRYAILKLEPDGRLRFVGVRSANSRQRAIALMPGDPSGYEAVPSRALRTFNGRR